MDATDSPGCCSPEETISTPNKPPAEPSYAACGKHSLHTGVPLFWRVTVERFGVDLAAARRLDGLATAIGSRFLADIMGPGEDVAKPVMDSITVALCEQCALDPRSPPVAFLALTIEEKSAGVVG